MYCTTFNASGNQIIYANASDRAYLLSKKLFPTGDVNVGTDSRVGKFSGNFGYYGDNGKLITADNVQIVNEGDKTIYNPATGTTSPVKDWVYDYSSRSYDLTLDTGDKITVTYGDENITIKQGDTNYTIYYITQGGGTTDPTPSPSPTATPGPTCKHNYTEEITKEPTCTAVGTLTKTCTLCNDTKTEQIPATGHNWVIAAQPPPAEEQPVTQTTAKGAGLSVKGHVATIIAPAVLKSYGYAKGEYTDLTALKAAPGYVSSAYTAPQSQFTTAETGTHTLCLTYEDASTEFATFTVKEPVEVPTPDYTLYRCTVCGQEYKDTEGTGPPEEDKKPGFLEWLFGKVGDLLGSIGNGVITLLQNTLGKVFDGLIALIDMVVEKLGGVIDALFRIFDEVPAMFEGFTGFLSAVFPFLPPEFSTILIFGILAVVLVAIVRAIIKR